MAVSFLNRREHILFTRCPLYYEYFGINKKQIKQIAQIEKSIFLDAVISHLERSEHYYSLGEDDDKQELKARFSN